MSFDKMLQPRYEYEFESEFNKKYSVVARKIIRLLSVDSRASISKISEYSGLSRTEAKKRLERIEKEFDINYVLELNERALGIQNPHLIMAKFGKKPDWEHIKGLLEGSYIPQFASVVEGDYDLLIYANSISSQEYALWDKWMQMELSKYRVSWRTSEVVHKQLGFFPIRNELLERLDMKDQEKRILIELNRDCRLNANEIAKKLGITLPNVLYVISKLEKDGIIWSYTISMGKPDWLTLMTFFAKYMPTENYENHSMNARKAFMSDDEYSIIDRYVMTAPLVGSYDFFTMGAFDSEAAAMEHDISYHKELFKDENIDMAKGTIGRVLLGRLPLRSVGTKDHYRLIKWTKQS